MKVVEPSVEILKQEDFSIKGIKRFIEQCARLSYKSEDKITEDSYEKFVQMLIDKDHARPLEFGTVHLKMNIDDFFEFLCNLSHSESLNCLWIKWYFNWCCSNCCFTKCISNGWNFDCFSVSRVGFN